MSILIITLFALLMLATAAFDITSYTIPNFVSVALVTLFALAVLWIAPPANVILAHAGVGAVTFVACFILFAVGVFGGGDAKVISALGFWFGPNDMLLFLFNMSIFGGILAGILVALRYIPLPVASGSFSWINDLRNKSNGIPYGVAICLAALLEFPKTAIYAGLLG